MSSQCLSIRLMGSLPPLAELIDKLGAAPTSYRTKDTPLPIRWKRMQPVDVWILDLLKWEGKEPESESLTLAISTLTSLAPAFAALPREGLVAELLFMITQHETWGGGDIPSQVLALAAAGRLPLTLSILTP